MKRLVLLVAALMVCGGALVPAGAGARPPGGAVAVPTAAASATAPAAVHAATLGWLRSHLVGFEVGPSRATGYGKGRLTGFTHGCPECRWFRATNRMTNHQPISRTSPGGQLPAALRRQGGFCWPWDSFPWSGGGCWNNMSSWNWGRILDSINYHPVWDPMSTLDRIVGCYHGAYQGFAGGVLGKQVVGIMIEMSDLVKVTPAGIAWSIIGGCAFRLFHH